MKTSNIVKQNDYQGHPLLSLRFYPDGFHGEILKSLLDHLRYAVSQSSQVFIVRLDIRFPVYYNSIIPANAVFIGFLANFIKYLKRHGCNPHYVWRVEPGQDNPYGHYHLALFLDGNQKQDGWSIKYKAEEFWASALGIEVEDVKKDSRLVHLCQPNSPDSHFHTGFKLQKYYPDFDRKLYDAYCWLSYITKVGPVEYEMPGNRAFGCSQLPVLFP